MRDLCIDQKALHGKHALNGKKLIVKLAFAMTQTPLPITTVNVTAGILHHTLAVSQP